jgi:hypothetical protein
VRQTEDSAGGQRVQAEIEIDEDAEVLEVFGDDGEVVSRVELKAENAPAPATTINNAGRHNRRHDHCYAREF